MGIGGFALVALLAVFHGRLLWQRLLDGSLLQPLVIARWTVSALLIVALLDAEWRVLAMPGLAILLPSMVWGMR